MIMNNLITKISLIVLVILLGSSTYAETPWVLSKKSGAIKVYLRDTPGSAIKSFKGEVSVPANLTSLVALIDDTKVYSQFFYQCKSAKNIKEVGNTQSYKYIVTAMPWPVKDRDTIVHSVISQNKNTKQVEIKMKAAPAHMPLKKGKVRIKKMPGRWLLTPEKNGMTKVVYEMTVDPAGSLPKWLVNTMSTDMPFNTLKNLQVLIKKPVYQSAGHVFIVN